MYKVVHIIASKYFFFHTYSTLCIINEMNEKNICWIIKFYLVDFVKNFMKNFKGLQIMF